jgi:hypothetical protein
MAEYKELTDYRPDGTHIGQATADKLAFYGKTPIVQRALAVQAKVSTTVTAAVSTTVTSKATSNTWGFTTSSQANSMISTMNAMITKQNAVVVLVNELRAALVAVGLIKGSA